MFIDKLFGSQEKDVAEEDTYEEARKKFITDYDIENPITRNKSIANLFDQVIKWTKNMPIATSYISSHDE